MSIDAPNEHSLRVAQRFIQVIDTPEGHWAVTFGNDDPAVGVAELFGKEETANRIALALQQELARAIDKAFVERLTPPPCVVCDGEQWVWRHSDDGHDWQVQCPACNPKRGLERYD